MTKQNINVLDPQYVEAYMNGYKDGKLNLTLDIYDYIFTGHTAKEVKDYCIKLYNEERGNKCN